jgi:hypothetical protein
MVADDGFEIEGSLSSYVVTGDSGKPVTRWFCAGCGSGIYLDSEADQGYVFLKGAAWTMPVGCNPKCTYTQQPGNPG